jgi:hypothetical protein
MCNYNRLFLLSTYICIMGLKAIYIHKHGKEELITPKGETFTLQELCDLIETNEIQLLPSCIHNCVIIADKYGKEKDNWFLNVNNKASELSKSSIGQATIVGNVILSNLKLLDDVIINNKN